MDDVLGPMVAKAGPTKPFILIKPRLQDRPSSGTCSYLRLIDSCITQLKAQGPSRTCNESKEEDSRIWYKTVKAKFWPWLSVKRPYNLLRCSLFARKRKHSEYGTYKTVKARFCPCLSDARPSNLVGCSLFARKRSDGCGGGAHETLHPHRIGFMF